MSLFLDDGDVRLYHGDALTVLQSLPNESVHMCVTSPPFYGLRDYGTGRWEGGNPDCDHLPPQPEPILYDNGQGQAYTSNNQNKKGRTYQGNECGCGARRVNQQIGLEETPEQWVDNLVAVFREVRRVLRDDGTLWLEVGDSYMSSQGGRQSNVGELPNRPLTQDVGLGTGDAGSWQSGATTKLLPQRGTTDLKPKDLIGAPWMLAFALRADGWYLRSDIVWARPNPMPESVTDRPTKSHSYVFLLAKRPRYFFDQEAVREPHQLGPNSNQGRSREGLDYQRPKPAQRDSCKPMSRESLASVPELYNPAGRNVRSVWNIATQPYPEAHFATFPEELARRCILAGTSERGACPECGRPWGRIVHTTYSQHSNNPNTHSGGRGGTSGHRKPDGTMVEQPKLSRNVETLGWEPSCECTTHRNERGELGAAKALPCVVLDPFVGSGTVPYVARKHGRHAIGIDLNVSYLELSACRLQQLSLFA